ncbi:MAG: type II secretion system F family protein [Acidobacteria bacterium]|nr:type II secretion system F family protein [Acidobacteriota bacterium]
MLQASAPPRRRPAKLDDDEDDELVLGSLTPALAGQSPVTNGRRAAIEQELREAGFYRRTALMEYAAIRAALVMVPIIGAGLLALLVKEKEDMPSVLIGGAILAVLGYSLPRLYLNYLGRVRTHQIERGLPVAVDLLALGVSGGQNILSALQRVTKEIRYAYPILADELEIVRAQASLNTLPHAMRQFADRVRVPEVGTLAVLLGQAERLGADVNSGLLEFSNNFRVNLRQRAEAQANRASFWMLFPAILCLWIPALIVLMGPLWFELKHRYAEVPSMLRQETATINPLNQQVAPFNAPRSPTTNGTVSTP